jgi:hypothetical protein
MMDNRIFNVNGCGFPMLESTLKLAFLQQGSPENPSTSKGWVFHKDYGLILLWFAQDPKTNKFPVPLNAVEVAPIVFNWLSSEAAKKMECTGWDKNADHDGENIRGWRVYVEDWGHIGDERSVICAIRPSYNWIGK